jgi:hypothetical protein
MDALQTTILMQQTTILIHGCTTNYNFDACSLIDGLEEASATPTKTTKMSLPHSPAPRLRPADF